MSADGRRPRGGGLLRFLGAPIRVAYLAAALGFLVCVGEFYNRHTGFTSLISIGDLLDSSKVTALRETPHHVYESTPGYDGAYYVQLALYPTLDNPELLKAIDNLPYRAKRILFCWAAWALGFGQPAWIVQVHALLNVACWLVLAVVLLRWFPPTDAQNLLRWTAVLFSHGLCMSVRHSLVDGPSLLLVALALRWLEQGRRGPGAATLALAGLGKETSLLATAGLDFDWRAPRTWGRTALAVILVTLPLAAWMAYVRLKFGPAEDPGLGNFTYPLAGYWERVSLAWREAFGPEEAGIYWATLATILALAVQALFFLLRWRPADRWWRVGAAFAGMMLFLSTPVWEGYPGASTRVLLPMTLAFNVLVPRTGRWLPVLLAGNLTVVASVFEFSPPHEFYHLRGDAALRHGVRVVPARGWHGPERHLRERWRWSAGESELRFVNEHREPVRIAVRGKVSAVTSARQLRVLLGDRLLWGDTVVSEPRTIQFGLVLPPGETVLVLTNDRPGEKVGTDPRDLAIRVANLDIFVSPPGSSR